MFLFRGEIMLKKVFFILLFVLYLTDLHAAKKNCEKTQLMGVEESVVKKEKGFKIELFVYPLSKIGPATGQIADIVAFPTSDFRDILYHQGELKASQVWKNGKALDKN